MRATTEMTKTIRILIADDHALIREGLRAFAVTRPDIELVGEATNGAKAVQMARSLQPDVILMDLVMPQMDGVQAIREIKQQNPNARILVLTSFSEDDRIFPAIKAGAAGYLLKDASPQELLQAIQDIHRGKTVLHPTIALRVMHELGQSSGLVPVENQLTERELEVLRLVAQGLSNRKIAKKLIISEQTVATHVGNILGKLYLENRTQAALYALREGMVTLCQRE